MVEQWKVNQKGEGELSLCLERLIVKLLWLIVKLEPQKKAEQWLELEPQKKAEQLLELDPQKKAGQ